ncbi:MBL fold metallo-hydrolase [Sanguibacter antarcticus]|uniref:Glyoxylase-like metal-dependent hydrolase (Beta-lactamase superfamily II) n=1 Tax=Sanguibacter antarcticus TaxID=372484 RepID=A0A2A9E354_9MICO|nr:MBL fold metallo-hydrolase [Sanguibacter antarcticus]PFG33274.1 glyoxylase-like metal-dependent hydrolase (beta-lactamase superfamily II) [Sanguibacter antarcticus]
MSTPRDTDTAGPTDLTVLDDLEIRTACVGPMSNNAYLLTCRGTGHQLLVDAADDADRLMGLIHEGTGRLDLVVTTHSHRDHHGALATVVGATSSTTAAGADDAAEIPVPTGRLLRHGDTIDVGRVTFDVVALRGHTPGSVSLVYTEPSSVQAAGAVPGRAHVFTGDSLFPGGVGSTRGDHDRFVQLIDDVTERVFDRYRDDTQVYPGHGAGTTLGAERPHLDEWRARGW